MTEGKKKRKTKIFIGMIIGIILVLIILPSLKPAKDSGPGYARVMCMSQLKTLCFAHYLYQDEYDKFPTKKIWCNLFQQKCDMGKNGFLCIKDDIGPCSYAINENIPADAETLPDDLVLFFESTSGWNQIGGVEDVVTDRHGEAGANIGFADGHAEFVEAEDVPNLRWVVEDKSANQ